MLYSQYCTVLYILLLIHCYCILHILPFSPNPTLIRHESLYFSKYMLCCSVKKKFKIYTHQSFYWVRHMNLFYHISTISTCVQATTSYLHLMYIKWSYYIDMIGCFCMVSVTQHNVYLLISCYQFLVVYLFR